VFYIEWYRRGEWGLLVVVMKVSRRRQEEGRVFIVREGLRVLYLCVVGTERGRREEGWAYAQTAQRL